MQLGRLGVWASMDGMTAAAAADFARRVEGWGYGALWVPESRGRNVLVISSWLLANTKTLTVATGIANIYARDPQATASGQLALAEQSGGRFLLGLGVSHVPLVEGLRGHIVRQAGRNHARLCRGDAAGQLCRAEAGRGAEDGDRRARPGHAGAGADRIPTARIPTSSRRRTRKRRATSWARTSSCARSRPSSPRPIPPARGASAARGSAATSRW